MPEASASKSALPPSAADYARKVHDNAPLRAQLREKYPDVYRDLASQMHRDLNGCVVTEIMPGTLKALCVR